MVSIYASFRPQIPTSAIAVASVSGGSVSHTISGNLYFQYYNRAGRNLLSAPIPVTINSGEKLQITVPVGAIADGETVFKVVFSLSTTGNEVDAQDIAAIQVRENSGSVITNFPATVELTADEHFVLSGEVPTFEDLPAASVIGMKRKVTADNVIYEYGYDARWQPARTGFSAYQADTTVTGGSDLVLTDAIDAIAVPDNPLDVESYPLRAWILNGYESDGLNPLPQGARYTFNFAINGSTTSVDDVPYSNIFANKTYVQILGYVERATGALDVSKAVNKKLWNGTENYIVLPEDLPRGHAALLSISLMVEESDLAGIATANSRITFDIERRSDSIPQLNPLAKMLGDAVLSDRGKLSILPGVVRLSGIASTQAGYAIDLPTDDTFGTALLATDTPNQKVILDGKLNGVLSIQNSSYIPDTGEIVRAIVGTAFGNTTPVTTTVAIAVTDPPQQLQITITNPTAIRSNYPDTLIRNLDRGLFNPPQGRLGLKIGGVFYEETTPRAVAGGTDIALNLSDLSGFQTATEFATNSDPSFGLYQAAIAVTNSDATSGGFTEDVTVYWRYEYPSSNPYLTSISHRIEDGAVITNLSPLAEAGDMHTSVYDTNLSGVVDKAEGIEGEDAAAKSTFYGINEFGAKGFHEVISASLPWTPLNADTTIRFWLDTSLDNGYVDLAGNQDPTSLSVNPTENIGFQTLKRLADFDGSQGLTYPKAGVLDDLDIVVFVVFYQRYTGNFEYIFSDLQDNGSGADRISSAIAIERGITNSLSKIFVTNYRTLELVESTVPTNYNRTGLSLLEVNFSDLAGIDPILINGTAGAITPPVALTDSYVPSPVSDRFNVGKIFYDGGVSPAFNCLNGFIAELIIVDSTATEQEKAKYTGYLAHKWGFDDRLPDTHPFKLAPPAQKDGLYVQGATDNKLQRLERFVEIPSKTITLDYTLQLEDLNQELVVPGGTGDFVIPSITEQDFRRGFMCIVALDGTGQITFKRSDGGSGGLIFSNENNQLKDRGSVTIRHRSNNVWKIEGLLTS